MPVYKSAYSSLQVLVRSEIVFYHPVTGVETQRHRRLTADFGFHGGTFNAPNPLTGEIEEHATIFGHYYDTDVAAEAEQWTEEETESVVATLDKLCREQPFLIARVDLSVPAAAPPWPTYDATPVTQVVKLATSLGLAREALLYEQENENREKVVAELEDWLTDNQPVPAEDEQSVGMITL